MAVLAQALGEVVGGLLVVFDEEDFHGLPVRRALVAGPLCLNPGQKQRSPTIQTFKLAAIRSPWVDAHIPPAKARTLKEVAFK
jgi:hypothetical protein